MKISNFVERISKIVLLLAFCLLNLQSAEAAIPKLITYHGILKNSAGSFLTGTYSMKFRIYTASTGGTSQWTETQSSVTVTSGRFTVELGSVTALNLSFNSDYWLSVEIGTDGEMTPRQRLTSVGYAYTSDDALNAFSESEHDALSHKNIEGVKDNTVNIGKTNFKLDPYSVAAANSMGDMIIDSFNDASGILAGSSSGYTWRGASNYDVVVTPTGGGVIQQSTTEDEFWEFISNVSSTAKGVGERFRHTSQVSVDRIGVKWIRYGSPSGNLKIRLYSDSSGIPGTLLAESASIAVSTVPTSYTEYTATLNTAVTIQANTDYHAVIESIDATGDGANHINVRRSNGGNPYSAGPSVSKNSGGSWQVLYDSSDTFFKVYEAVAPSGNATVVSVAWSEPVAPTETIVIADETLNGGTITYYVSRDNGTTWTQCTKETVTNISSQPSGTQVKWKAVISGGAELNSIAVAV